MTAYSLWYRLFPKNLLNNGRAAGELHDQTIFPNIRETAVHWQQTLKGANGLML